MKIYEINQKIVELTSEINRKYPELSKYLSEMTVTLPDEEHPHITLEKLQAYYKSLQDLLQHYAETHKPKSTG